MNKDKEIEGKAGIGLIDTQLNNPQHTTNVLRKEIAKQ